MIQKYKGGYYRVAKHNSGFVCDGCYFIDKQTDRLGNKGRLQNFCSFFCKIDHHVNHWEKLSIFRTLIEKMKC